MLDFKKIVLSVGILSSISLGANASPVTYLGADDNVSSLSQMTNALAANANFLAIAGNLGTVDFESPLPSNLTITGGSIVNDSGCGPLCGFNTTSGGAYFESVGGGSVTFSFTNPVDAFGFYVNGLQTSQVPQQTIVYVDGFGNTQTINFPSSNNGGGAFVGFIDYGQLISSVTFNATNDILGFDDLRFGKSETDPGNPNQVPEPFTLSLFSAGFAGIAAVRRRRRAKNVNKA